MIDDHYNAAGSNDISGAARQRHIIGFAVGLLIVLSGAFAFLVLGAIELSWVSDQPGAKSLLLIHPDAEWDSSFPAQLRRIPLEETLKRDPFLYKINQVFDNQDVLNIFGGERTELLLHAQLEQDLLATYLRSGRLPEPGKPEVLAGDLSRFDTFVIDDIQFEVVGHLHNTVAAALYAYILPWSSEWTDFFAADDALNGVYISNLSENQEELSTYIRALFKVDEDNQHNRDDVEDEVDSQQFVPDSIAVGSLLDNADSQHVGNVLEAENGVLPDMPFEELSNDAEAGRAGLRGGQIRTLPIFSWSGFMLHMLITLGGTLTMYNGIAWWFYRNNDNSSRHLAKAVMDWRSIYFTLHLLLYGVLFTFMFAGLNFPLHNYRFTEIVANIFSEGDLQHVGDAYASGSVLSATWATFYNNYIDQTLLLVYAISLIAIPFGVIKTALSFALVGFVMVPVWVGQNAGYSYHSITMVLELQAYILACFAVVMWPVFLLWGLARNNFREEAKSGLFVMLHSALLVGIILLVAAFYEAVTLIHIGGAAGI